MHRRRFLHAAFCAGASLPLVPAIARAAVPPQGAAALQTIELAPELHLMRGGGGNVTVFNSPAGVLLVDGGAPAHSAQVLKAVRSLTGRAEVHTLFNTHWHWDQTGLNATLGPAGTRIIAHENTKLWLSTDVDSKWEQRQYRCLPPKARPNQTFYTTGLLEFGDETIEYGHLFQAHTDGDIYVHFRKANVLVAGDVLAVGQYPVIDYCTGGWIGGMASAAQALQEHCNADTRVIPGMGPVQSREQLKAEHAMLTEMRTRLSRLLAQGMSIQDMIDAAPTRDFDAQWGDPKLFIANVWQGLIRRTGELGVSIV